MFSNLANVCIVCYDNRVSEYAGNTAAVQQGTGVISEFSEGEG